jgi:hypothetical protein
MSASFVCCRVEVYASGRSLVQRSPTECGVSECDREASIMRWPRPTGGLLDQGKKNNTVMDVIIIAATVICISLL